MVEYDKYVGYSMPSQCGLYPPPPYKYRNTRALILFFQCAAGVKEKYLPPELESIENGFDTCIILDYPDSSIDPYHESLITLSCIHKEIPGEFVFSIFVDTDDALAAGREIWGIPKKMGEIYLSSLEDNKVRGTVTRKGITLLDVEVDILNNPPGLDPKDMFANMPFYNLKFIPDVADNSKPALRQLTGVTLKIEDIHKNFAIIPKSIKTNQSQFDIFHEILSDANKEIGGFYVEYDFILPNGQVLE